MLRYNAIGYQHNKLHTRVSDSGRYRKLFQTTALSTCTVGQIGVQVIYVFSNNIATAPEVGLMDDARLLRHVSHAPEDWLAHKEIVGVG
jgi:hypothetical protein